VGAFDMFRIGDGALKPELRSELESEGLVLAEEGLSGSVRYTHFKAPGRRFHGKVTKERIALGVSETRLVVYCRSGSAKLIDTPFDNPRAHLLEVYVEDGSVVFRIDYDRVQEDRVSGVVRILAATPNAERIAGEVAGRLAG
jgi:hypothetical protein